MDNIKAGDQQTSTPTEKVIYTAKAHTIGGRDGGSSRTSDGRLDVKLSLPGTPGNGTNPEQLFAAGWSSCFLSALKIAAAQRKLKFPEDAVVDAEVDLCSTNHDYSIQARLNIALPGFDAGLAWELAGAAHLLCPYSKATHGNIKVETNIV